MASESTIEWTDATANVVVGCSRKSTGCERCFAERLAATRLRHLPQYQGLAAMKEHGPQWTGTVRLVPETMQKILGWKKPRRIFLTSMGDPFHESLPFEQIAALFGLMAACPQHTFQLLTKRPERMVQWFDWVTKREVDGRRMFPDDSPAWRIRQLLRVSASRAGVERLPQVQDGPWPLPNVWLGTSTENQATADERIPHLLRVPAVVRFLSCEPLLGPVNLEHVVCQDCHKDDKLITDSDPPWCSRCDNDACFGMWLDPCADVDQRGINWVIVGGESGPDARPCDVMWIRSIVEQCKGADVACFVKQLGALPLVGSKDIDGLKWSQLDPKHSHGDDVVLVRLRDSKGGNPLEWPDDLRVQQFPEVSR